LGAIALSLTTELSDTIRRANNEARFQEQQVIVEQMKKQADTMRDQAITNLCMSVAVAGVQIAMSAYQVKASASALQGAQGMTGDMQAAFLQNQNLQIQGTAAGIGAAGSLLGGVKDFVSSMFDIEMKARDAEIERHRSFLMQLDSLNDSLKQVIQSAIQNQNAIQRNINETRVKILS
jgi:FlaG/FlaF family flagellin (archaellin)